MRRIHMFSNSNAIKAANRKHNLIAVMRAVTWKLIYDITVSFSSNSVGYIKQDFFGLVYQVLTFELKVSSNNVPLLQNSSQRKERLVAHDERPSLNKGSRDLGRWGNDVSVTVVCILRRVNPEYIMSFAYSLAFLPCMLYNYFRIVCTKHHQIN